MLLDPDPHSQYGSGESQINADPSGFGSTSLIYMLKFREPVQGEEGEEERGPNYGSAAQTERGGSEGDQAEAEGSDPRHS